KEESTLPPPLEEGMMPSQKGDRFYFSGDLTRAQRQWEIARDIFYHNNKLDYYAITLTNLGEIELMRGRLMNAANLHRKALGFHEDEDVKSEVAPYDNVCLGRVYMLTGEYPAARSSFDEALRLLKIDADKPRNGPGE